MVRINVISGKPFQCRWDAKNYQIVNSL